MAGLFDLLMSATGHPDPSMQMAAALGQAPGQPGNSGGPQPLAGANGPSPNAPGGPGAAPGGPTPGAAAAPPIQTQQQPSPAYATPQDLGSMMVTLMQRQQASEGFNRSLGLLAAGFANPRDRATIVDSMSGMGGNAASTMQTLMQLQNWQREQQQYQALQAAAPALAVQLFGEGADKDPAKMAQASAIIASGKYGDIEANLAGVGGSPAWQAQRKAEKAFTDAGKPIPWTPGDPTSFTAYQTRMQDRQKEVDATQGNFQGAVQGYDEQLKNVDELMDPKNRPALDELTGWYNSTIKPTAQLSDAALRLKKVYDTVMAGQFASAVQDFPGSRISTKELQQDAPSKSTMGLVQSTGDLLKATQDYRNQITLHRANLFGKAEQLNSSQLSDADYAQVSPIYKTGGDLASAKGINRAGPDTSVKTEADIANLPHGRAFVIPDGSGRIGYAP